MGTQTAPTLKPKTLKVKVSADVVDGERQITAVVSSDNLDRDNERVDVKSLRLPLKGGGQVTAGNLLGTELIDIPLLINHSFDVSDVIGSVRSAYVDQSDELVFVFGISSRLKAQDLMLLIDEQHLDNAFSITMSDYTFDGTTIFDAEVIEVSLVFRGSNKDARILAVKSIIKGENMTLAEKKAEAERLLKEVEAEEAKTDKEKAEEVVTPPVKPVEAPAPVEEPVVVPPTKPKEEKSMSDKIAAKQVREAPVEVEVIEKKPTMTKREQRELFVKQFLAYKAKDTETLSKLNQKAFEADSSEDKEYKRKAISYSDGAALYQTAVVSADILLQYTNFASLGSLTNQIDILGAETWKRIVQTAGTGFQPVGMGEVKQEDKPVWTSQSSEPKEWAVIVAWFDAVARRTPVAVYNQLVQYIASEWVKLEDKIILQFPGVTTTGGDVFAATGVVPAMVAAQRIVNVATFGAADVQQGLGRAYGMLLTDRDLTLVCNRKTWGLLATVVDTQGRNIFTQVGQQVTAGALGTFNVRLSQFVPDGDLVVGAFGDYDLITRGGLETLFSREASVGSLNLFTSDASALRAAAEITGRPVRNESFVLIDFVANVS